MVHMVLTAEFPCTLGCQFKCNVCIKVPYSYDCHFATAVVADDFFRMTAPSSALWSTFSTPSDFVSRHMSTTWFVVCHWPQPQEGVIGQDPICAGLDGLGLGMSIDGCAKTMCDLPRHTWSRDSILHTL